MKQMTLEEIQQVSLDILKEFHAFCVSNNIRYSLAYGTLIGAIRHKGFIPWDDDVDVMMGRKDFERFFELYPSSGRFKAVRPEQTYMNIGRLYDGQKTLVDTEVPWKKGETGVWIDIFPIDCVSDNEEDFLKFHSQCAKLHRRQVRKRKLKYPFLKLRNKRKIKYIFNIFSFRNSLSRILKKHRTLLATHPYGTTNHCCQLAIPDNGTKDYIPLQMMNEYIEVDFAGEKMMSIKDYDTYLRNIYGNYMELPPAEKQVPQQDNYIKFYWKEQ